MKKFLLTFKPLIFLILCIVIIATFACTAFATEENFKAVEESQVINIWQVDSFEGGKGSRADFLKKTGEAFAKQSGCYVTVTSLSSDAVRMNIFEGIYPDIISYGAGMYGLESYIEGYATWCYGGYCLLTLDTNADFTDASTDNTVINAGKENLISLTALMCGLQGATPVKSTGAYVKLISGEYKYLLGTQRDIFRLKTRAVGFTVKPITVFNDLYQNISVISKSKNKKIATDFIDFLLSKREDVKNIGMFCKNKQLYDDELKAMEMLEYEYRLTSPISADTLTEIKKNIEQGDVNKLKILLK